MLWSLQKFRHQLLAVCAWRDLRILLLIDTLIAVALSFIFAPTANWWENLFGFLICSHAIGTSIYFLIGLTGVLNVVNIWKRSLLLGGLFMLGGGIGTLLAFGILVALSIVTPDWPSYFSWLKTSTLFALIFGALVTGYFVLRHRLEENAAKLAEKEINEQRLLQLKTKAELEALRVKVNPHFLFNTLNSIASLIPVDPVKAEEMVQKLAHLFRFTLEASHHEMMKLTDELQVIREYLAIEKIRLGERLSYEITMEEALVNMRLPGLLLQPLVENSVRHGIAPAKSGGKIQLHCRANENFCYIEIHDTGQGFSGATITEHFGLTSVRERLALNYGTEYEFKITPGPGVHIFLKLPWRKDEQHRI